MMRRSLTVIGAMVLSIALCARSGGPTDDLFVASSDTDDPAPARIVWQRLSGTRQRDQANGVALTSEGDICLAGQTGGELAGKFVGKVDGFVASYSGDGVLLWRQQIGSKGVDIAMCVAVDGDDNIYVGGHTSGFLARPRAGNVDAFLAKYSSDGELAWMRQFGSEKDDRCRGVAVDADGNSYAVGETLSNVGPENVGGREIFIAKRDAHGKAVWFRQFEATGDTSAMKVVIGDDGNLWIGGQTSADLAAPNQGSADAMVLLCDSDGRQLAADQFGTFAVDMVSGIAVDGRGGGFVAAHTQGSVDGPPGRVNEILLARYDSDGRRQWLVRREAYGRLENAFGVGADRDGTLYLVGSVQRPLGGPAYTYGDIFLAAYAPDGREKWTFQLGSEDSDTPRAMAVDDDGRCIIVGGTRGGPATNDLGYGDAFIVVIEPTPESPSEAPDVDANDESAASEE